MIDMEKHNSNIHITLLFLSSASSHRSTHRRLTVRMNFRYGVWWIRIVLGKVKPISFIFWNERREGWERWEVRWVRVDLYRLEVMMRGDAGTLSFIFCNGGCCQAKIVVKEEWHPVSAFGHDFISSV